MLENVGGLFPIGDDVGLGVAQIGLVLSHNGIEEPTWLDGGTTELDLEVSKDELALLDENTLTIKGLENVQPNEISSVKFEIKRDGDTTWYEIGSGSNTVFTGKARIAGEFLVRATLEINGTLTRTDEEEVEVVFPDSNVILNGDGVRTRMDQAWADTINATTSTSRREEGYYITLNTHESSESYGITQHTVGNPVGNADSPTLPLGSRPDDDPDDPNPTQSATYIVAWFHTHTPATHVLQIPGFQALRRVGPSGTPGGTGDHGFGSHIAVNAPGFVYDYIATTTVAGSGEPAIPLGHPMNAAAKVYFIEPPAKRPTP